MTSRGKRQLEQLEVLRTSFGAPERDQKLVLLASLERLRLSTAGQVLRFHEVLCFMRAYPDDHEILERVEHLLASFGRRGDLRKHQRALADSGIVNTAIHYQLFWPMATWLQRRWPDRLHYDWEDPGDLEPLRPLLPLFVSAAEAKDARRGELELRAILDRLRGDRDTDASFVLRRLAAVPGGSFCRETIHDALDAPYRLEPDDDRPSRTGAKLMAARVAYQGGPLHRARPDLRTALRRPPVSIRPVAPQRARDFIDLAQEAMVTRSRDLEVFDYANPEDVNLVDDGEGLCFASIGFLPVRRLPLLAGYGLLTLKNGVPIGYVQADALLKNIELSYNTFETFRGAEAAHVFGRVLSAVSRLLGASSYSIEPYQLGHNNSEAIDSGAWWFYYKLGFRPLDSSVQAILDRELRAMKRKPAHRSSKATLRKLAAHRLYFNSRSAGKLRDVSLSHLGRAVTRLVRERFGADRESAARTLARETLERLGLRSWRSKTSAERLWVQRWAPYLALLRGIETWSADERRAVVDIVRAKAGRRETDFIARFDAHRKLGPALLAAERAASRHERARASVEW